MTIKKEVILESIKNALMHHSFGVNEDVVISEITIIDELDIDSLGKIETVMSIEDEYSIEIDDDQLEQMETVGDLIKIVESLI